MRRKIFFTLLIIMIAFRNANAQTWDEFFRQKKTQRKYLLEQIAKLQLYLDYLKKGYDILQTGLTTISEIKHGDLSLHSLYFTSLKNVSPTVKKYSKVGDIILMQLKMISQYKTSFKSFQHSGLFSKQELDFLQSVFTNVLSETAEEIDALTAVLTDGELQLKDDERIRRIDKVYDSVSEQYGFLFSFCSETTANANLKAHELNDATQLREIYGLK